MLGGRSGPASRRSGWRRRLGWCASPRAASGSTIRWSARRCTGGDLQPAAGDPSGARGCARRRGARRPSRLASGGRGHGARLRGRRRARTLRRAGPAPQRVRGRREGAGALGCAHRRREAAQPPAGGRRGRRLARRAARPGARAAGPCGRRRLRATPASRHRAPPRRDRAAPGRAGRCVHDPDRRCRRGGAGRPRQGAGDAAAGERGGILCGGCRPDHRGGAPRVRPAAWRAAHRPVHGGPARGDRQHPGGRHRQGRAVAARGRRARPDIRRSEPARLCRRSGSLPRRRHGHPRLLRPGGRPCPRHRRARPAPLSPGIPRRRGGGRRPLRRRHGQRVGGAAPGQGDRTAEQRLPKPQHPRTARGHAGPRGRLPVVCRRGPGARGSAWPAAPGSQRDLGARPAGPRLQPAGRGARPARDTDRGVGDRPSGHRAAVRARPRGGRRPRQPDRARPDRAGRLRAVGHPHRPAVGARARAPLPRAAVGRRGRRPSLHRGVTAARPEQPAVRPGPHPAALRRGPPPRPPAGRRPRAPARRLHNLRTARRLPLGGAGRTELRVSGETARRRDPSTLDQLTPRSSRSSASSAKGRPTARSQPSSS